MRVSNCPKYSRRDDVGNKTSKKNLKITHVSCHHQFRNSEETYTQIPPRSATPPMISAVRMPM